VGIARSEAVKSTRDSGGGIKDGQELKVENKGEGEVRDRKRRRQAIRDPLGELLPAIIKPENLPAHALR